MREELEGSRHKELRTFCPCSPVMDYRSPYWTFSFSVSLLILIGIGPPCLMKRTLCSQPFCSLEISLPLLLGNHVEGRRLTMGGRFVRLKWDDDPVKHGSERFVSPAESIGREDLLSS